MDHLLGETWRNAVFDHLDYLDRLATDSHPSARAAVVEAELPRLTQAWRDVLDQHEPDDDDRCPQCSRWHRPRRFPCPIWTTVHEHFFADPGSGRRYR